MPNIIHKALWTLLILISQFYDLLWQLVVHFKFYLGLAYDFCCQKGIAHEIKYLEGCRKDMTKIPKHLSVVIGYNEGISTAVLSRIAVYALIMDVEYVTFYDTRNKFTLDQFEIPKFVASKPIQTGSRFLWSLKETSGKAGQLKYRNGLQKSVELVLLTEKDGKILIADVCKELIAKRESPDFQSVLSDKTELSKEITSSLGKRLNHLPEPELGIIFNKHMCTFGLLPWHTRFTEFYTIETGNYCTVQSFVDILYKYSKCQQRFGK